MSVSDTHSASLDFATSDEEVSSFKRSKTCNSEENYEPKPGPSHFSEDQGSDYEASKSKDKDEDKESEPMVNIIPMHELDHTLEKLVNKKLEKYLSKEKTKSKKRKNIHSEERDRKYKKKCLSDESLSSISMSSDISSDSSSDDEIFVIKDDNETGKALKDSTRKFLHKRFKNTIKKECFMKILRKYKTPKNALFIKAQKTNNEIWGKLRHYSKSNDNSLTHIQRNISKATIAIAKASESKKKEDCKDLMQDGLTILGQTHKQISALRRTMQKAVLPFNLRKACDQEEEDDELLFGQDLAKRIKETKEHNIEEHSKKRLSFLEKRRNFSQAKQNQSFRHKKFNFINNNNNSNKVRYQNRK